MSSLARLLWLFVLLVPWGAQAQRWLASGTTQEQPEFLEARDVFRVEATAGNDGRTQLHGTIAPGYYLAAGFLQRLQRVQSEASP